MITKKLCPNFTKGRISVQYIIIHWFGIGTLESANNRFQNPDNQSSAHYGISDNTIYQWVEEENTAWHAGVLDINKKSIGIEHDATTTKEMSEATYQTSAKLIKEICQRYNLPINRDTIKGHKEFKATQCPGTIDLDKLIRLASEDNMTDEQKRILEFLAGKTEGDVRQAFGALSDLASKNEQILNLTNKVHELELQMVEVNTALSEIKLNFIEKEKEALKWQKLNDTANTKLSEQILKNEELDKLAKDNKNLYLKKNDDFNNLSKIFEEYKKTHPDEIVKCNFINFIKSLFQK